MRSKFFKILALVLLPFVVFELIQIRNQKITAAEAHNVQFGLLTVDLGVPSGDPVFVVANMLPGDCVTKTIKVKNEGDVGKSLVVRSDNVDDPDHFADALNIKISEASELYNNTLTQFFADSDSMPGVALGQINPGASKNYDFQICFDSGSGNEYQNKKVVFDLVFGEKISDSDIPDACKKLGALNKIVGDDRNNHLHGSHRGDLIIGLGGNDNIEGGAGEDCIVGGPGNDKLSGGSRNDVILGNEGNDDISGGSGDDLIYAGAGNDKVEAGSGDDKVYGEEGQDNLFGGGGNDFLDGGPDHDFLKGESGHHDVCINGESVHESCEEVH